MSSFHPVAPLRPTFALLAAGLLLTGCTLVDKKTRPDAAAENVFCALEYRPATHTLGTRAGRSADENETEDRGRHENQDLLFLAWSWPYRLENGFLSPEIFFHWVAAPGRHLKTGARVQGATCSGGPWPKGFRLPFTPSSKKWMLCTRRGLEEVVFQVETKWGQCTQRIPRGDGEPRDLGGIRQVRDLPELGHRVEPRS